jgi:hypothetical protein
MTVDEAIAADALHTATLLASCGCRLLVSPGSDTETASGHYLLSVVSCEGGVWGPFPIAVAALTAIVAGESQEWRSAQGHDSTLERLVFASLSGERKGVDD